EAITARRDVPLESVAEALAELWRKADADAQGEPHGSAVVRACGLTIVALCGDRDDSTEVSTALAGATSVVPARTLIVVRDPAAKDGLSAQVAAFCTLGPGGKQVCQEQVFLDAAPDRWDDLPPLIGALPVADLPVVLLARDPRMLDGPVLDGLLPAVDLVVTDLARSRAPRADFTRMRKIERRLNVGIRDLAFERLVVWREAIACAWDRVATGRTSLLALETTAPPDDVEALLLCGWVASRLGKDETPRSTLLVDAARSRLAAVRLVFDVDGVARTVRLERHGDHVLDMTESEAEHENCALPRPMPTDADVLPHLLADPQTSTDFDRALHAACERLETS
ncbi:MAG: glucose-6-phosphate dehydrogenase assembly protein OpcA, partial [Planctomycetota bacterium JB042]